MAANMVSSNRRSVDRRVVKYVPPTFREMTSGNFKNEKGLKIHKHKQKETTWYKGSRSQSAGLSQIFTILKCM